MWIPTCGTYLSTLRIRQGVFASYSALQLCRTLASFPAKKESHITQSALLGIFLPPTNLLVSRTSVPFFHIIPYVDIQVRKFNAMQ